MDPFRFDPDLPGLSPRRAAQIHEALLAEIRREKVRKSSWVARWRRWRRRRTS